MLAESEDRATLASDLSAELARHGGEGSAAQAGLSALSAGILKCVKRDLASLAQYV